MRREMQNLYRGSGPDVVLVLHCSAVAYQARVALDTRLLGAHLYYVVKRVPQVAQPCRSAVRGSLYNRVLQSSCQLQAPVLWHALEKHLSM